MDFEKELQKFMKDNGYKYLGSDGGLIFYETRTGKRFGASEESFAKRILKKKEVES